MNYQWFYEIDTWQLGVFVVGVTFLFGVSGLILTRFWLYESCKLNSETNESVNGLTGGVGVFIGLLVGLMAVAAWSNFDDVGKAAGREAAQIAVIYRDIAVLNEPQKSALQNELKAYLRYVIDVAWPAHKRGESPRGGADILTQFLSTLTSYDIKSQKDQVLFAQTLSDYAKLIEARRTRLESVNVRVPGVLWVVVLCTAALSIFLTYFFHLSSFRAHVILTGIFSMVLGLMIFLLIALDSPFRGGVSIETEDYESLLKAFETHPSK